MEKKKHKYHFSIYIEMEGLKLVYDYFIHVLLAGTLLKFHVVSDSNLLVA